MPSEISFPFRLDPSGAIAVESNPDQQVINHMIALVGTQPGERVCMPTYGVNTLLSLFEPNDEFIAQHLSDMVRTAANTYEAGVQIVSVTSDPSVQAQGVVQINVNFLRVNSGANSPSNPSQVFTATIKANGDIR